MPSRVGWSRVGPTGSSELVDATWTSKANYEGDLRRSVDLHVGAEGIERSPEARGIRVLDVQ